MGRDGRGRGENRGGDHEARGLQHGLGQGGRRGHLPPALLLLSLVWEHQQRQDIPLRFTLKTPLKSTLVSLLASKKIRKRHINT